MSEVQANKKTITTLQLTDASGSKHTLATTDKVESLIAQAIGSMTDIEGNMTLGTIKGSATMKAEDADATSEIGASVIMPSGDVVFGTKNVHFKGIYADEIHAGAHTLYINGTPVLGKETGADNSQTINIKADPGQNILTETTGNGNSTLKSASAVKLQAVNEENKGILIDLNQSGSLNINNNVVGGSINMTAGSAVDDSANINITCGANGKTSIKNLAITGALASVNSNNLEITDKLITINKNGAEDSYDGAGIEVDISNGDNYYIRFEKDETNNNKPRFKVGRIGNLQTVATQEYVTKVLPDISGKADKATTIEGYGITDASINNGVITLGSNTITPLVSTSSLDATKLTGTISLERLPKAALERLAIVANDTARFALTIDTVQLGDTVKVTSTKKMYIVINENALDNENGYEEYTVGTAAAVEWSGVLNKPTLLDSMSVDNLKFNINSTTSFELSEDGNVLTFTIGGKTAKFHAVAISEDNANISF